MLRHILVTAGYLFVLFFVVFVLPLFSYLIVLVLRRKSLRRKFEHAKFLADREMLRRNETQTLLKQMKGGR